MPALAIFLAAIAVAAAVFLFVQTTPAGPGFWYGHPLIDLLEAWLVLVAHVGGAQAGSVLSRCGEAFGGVARWLDAGGDVPFQITVAERTYILSLVFSVVLAGLAIYGYFARRRT